MKASKEQIIEKHGIEKIKITIQFISDLLKIKENKVTWDQVDFILNREDITNSSI